MNWSTFWSATSAIFTCAATIIAMWAMFRWKKQEELKAKMAFKSSIAEYLNTLLYLPEYIAHVNTKTKYATEIKALVDAFSACNHAWLITEGILESNKEVNQCWKKLLDQHKNYLSGKIGLSLLGAYCMGILQERFIFK